MSARMRITPEQLTKSLEVQGIRSDTLKARIKAEMVWTSLVRGRYKESLQVGEKDVAAAVPGQWRRKAADRGLRIQDATGCFDRPARIGTRRHRGKTKEAEALRSRVQSCADANASSSRCKMPRYARP